MYVNVEKTWVPTEWCAAAYSNDLDNLLWAHGHGCNQYKSNDTLIPSMVESSPYVLDNAWKGILDFNKPAKSSWYDHFLKTRDKDKLRNWVASRKRLVDRDTELRGKSYLDMRDFGEVSDDSSDDHSKTKGQRNATKAKNNIREAARGQKRQRSKSLERFHGARRGAVPSFNAPGPGNALPAISQNIGKSFQAKCGRCSRLLLFSSPKDAKCPYCSHQQFLWLMGCDCRKQSWEPAASTLMACDVCSSFYFPIEC
jgi:hypothetical protein